MAATGMEGGRKEDGKTSRLRAILTGVTLEPMTILWSFAGSLCAIPTDQMLIYKERYF